MTYIINLFCLRDIKPLINFLKEDLSDLIKTGYNISKIDQLDKQIKLSFENDETKECDYLIVSDGVFSKSKSLISNNKTKPKLGISNSL